MSGFLSFLLEISFVHWLVILSFFIGVLGAVPYIRDTISGKTKPNRVTWFFWGAAPILGTFAAISSGADMWASVRVFLAGFLPLLVFISSFVNPKSYWKLGKFDFACGAVAAVGIGFWIFASSPQLAILFLASADLVASLPTLKKIWTNPETETGTIYISSFISALLIIPSIPVWNIENSAFQIYLLVVNGFMLVGVYRKRFWFKNKFISN